MAAVTASTTVQHPPFRRSSTVPTRLQPRTSAAQSDDAPPDDTSEETLFAHPAAKIVSFNAPSLRAQTQDAGTLPWTSRSERVISVGPLRLYRLRGSVSFLQSGSLHLPLLPRSQCWCVDGESKFAMRIQMLIYRIELPFSSDEDRRKVEELKKVLKEVLQYETTTCPFKRGFTVDVPLAELPRKRHLIGPYSKAQKWEMSHAWRREGPARLSSGSEGKSSPDISDEDAVHTGLDDGIFDNEDVNKLSPISVESPILEETAKMTMKPPPPVEPYRSVTAPAHVPLVNTVSAEVLQPRGTQDVIISAMDARAGTPKVNHTADVEISQPEETEDATTSAMDVPKAIPNINHMANAEDLQPQETEDAMTIATDNSGPLYNPSIITKLNPAPEFDPVSVILSPSGNSDIEAEDKPREQPSYLDGQSASVDESETPEKERNETSPPNASVHAEEVGVPAVTSDPNPASAIPETPPQHPENPLDSTSDIPTPPSTIRRVHPIQPPTSETLEPTTSKATTTTTNDADEDIFRPLITTTKTPPSEPTTTTSTTPNPSPLKTPQPPPPSPKTPKRTFTPTTPRTSSSTVSSAQPPSAYLISRTFSLLLGPPSGLITAVRHLASRVFVSPTTSTLAPRRHMHIDESREQGRGGLVGRYKANAKKKPLPPGRWPESDSESEIGSLRSRRSNATLQSNLSDLDRISDLDPSEDEAEGGDRDGEDGEEDEDEDGETEDDDYGIPLVSPVRKIKERWGSIGRLDAKPRPEASPNASVNANARARARAREKQKRGKWGINYNKGMDDDLEGVD